MTSRLYLGYISASQTFSNARPARRAPAPPRLPHPSPHPSVARADLALRPDGPNDSEQPLRHHRPNRSHSRTRGRSPHVDVPAATSPTSRSKPVIIKSDEVIHRVILHIRSTVQVLGTYSDRTRFWFWAEVRNRISDMYCIMFSLLCAPQCAEGRTYHLFYGRHSGDRAVLFLPGAQYRLRCYSVQL